MVNNNDFKVKHGLVVSSTATILSTATAISTDTGAVIVAGGVGIGGNLYVGGEIVAQKLTIQYTTVTTTIVETDDIITTFNTATSTSTDTGALIIAGGAGIGKDVSIGGNLTFFTNNSAAGAGSKIDIATGLSGTLVGYDPQIASLEYNPTLIGTYPVGSTITFQDSSTATITQWDDYGPTYLDLFWDTPKTGDIFPITLKTIDYVEAASSPARIIVKTTTGTEQQWLFGADGKLTTPGKIDILSTENSISTTTGALTVAGGVGIAGGIIAASTSNINGITFKQDGVFPPVLDEFGTTILYDGITTSTILFADGTVQGSRAPVAWTNGRFISVATYYNQDPAVVFLPVILGGYVYPGDTYFDDGSFGTEPNHLFVMADIGGGQMQFVDITQKA
jgi:hypothetical protein